ncbi:MAG: hypothetical protein ACKD6M_04010 [Candidatus Bathyarchaeota archaeon]
MESLKKEFLELLERDLKFRYAVAGYLGLSEILKRLDSIAEEQVKLREEQTKIWVEIEGLRKEQVSLREEQTKIWVEIEGLRKEQVSLREEQTKIWMEIKALREEQVRLREDFNRAFVELSTRLSRVERTLEKVTLDVEDEARIVIQYRLKEMGYDVKLAPLILPKVEINVYGVSDEVCIVGEATVRASSNVIDKINGDVEILRRIYPEKLKPRILKVVYTSLAMPDLVERAEKEGVWVLRATGDVVKPPKV